MDSKTANANKEQNVRVVLTLEIEGFGKPEQVTTEVVRTLSRELSLQFGSGRWRLFRNGAPVRSEQENQ